MALLRASVLVAASYRVQTLLTIGGLLVSIAPLYFVAGALQQTMGSVIEGEGSQYFAFVLVGTVAFMFVSEALGIVPGLISGSIGSGWFDTILMAPTPLPVAVAGLGAYGILFAFLRATVLMVAGALLGAHVAWLNLPMALLVVALITVSYAAIGVLAASLVVAFRTAGPLPGAVLLLSGLLGGVYYPTRVLPGWIRELANYVPLAPGLRALRRLLLDGAGAGDVLREVIALVSFAVLLSLAGGVALHFALRYARKAGTLATY